MMMSDFVLDLALPRSDSAVYVQVVVMGIIWTVVIGVLVAIGARREYRTFAVGLAVVNFAWFAARTVH